MIESFIALASIFWGILGANTLGYSYKQFSFGITGNTLIGVFGGTAFIKSFGRLGFDPWHIMAGGDINYTLLLINIIVSIIGGTITLILAKKLWLYFNQNKK
ncbi:hypothetical protein GO491_06120 [Flavobacteriaceae bacterium Ap0902]|nr:hypothetical protein [Flavobacteriaceae bacterium Ap0902]